MTHRWASRSGGVVSQSAAISIRLLMVGAVVSVSVAFALRGSDDARRMKSAVTATSGTSSVSSSPAAALVPIKPQILLRRTGDHYEVEIQAREGFPGTVYPLVMKIGATEVRHHRSSPTIGDFGVVYSLSQAQFDTLADGTPVVLQYGPSEQARRQYGVLQKSTARE